MIIQNTLRNGLRNAVDTMWELAKAIVPLTILVSILKATGWLNIIAEALAPAMSILGLPGEAALVLVAGYCITLYSAIAVIITLDLTAKQITILAIMLALCHSLFLETAVTKKTGVKALPLTLLRVCISFLMGFVVNLLY